MTSHLSDAPATTPGDKVLLCHGVVWPGRAPHLAVTDHTTGANSQVPLMGARLGFKVVNNARHCTGHTVMTGPAKGHQPCRDRAVAASGSACERCGSLDEFRFAHQYHRGGYATAGLREYMSQPHWLYVATFADGTSKIGTAAGQRQLERLDEQGPALATYVARVPDGALVRTFEDAVSSRLGVVQVKRKTAKVAALTSPASAGAVNDAHASIVYATRLLLSSEAGRAGVLLTQDCWVPPAATVPVAAGLTAGGWPPYPHDVRTGEHGFLVDAVAGSVIVARLEDDPTATQCVTDLSVLRGRLVTFGKHSSPTSSFQTSLF